jgi:hypothetical protein
LLVGWATYGISAVFPARNCGGFSAKRRPRDCASWAAYGASNAGAASSNPEAPNFADLLKQLISLQAQLAAPTTSLSI